MCGINGIVQLRPPGGGGGGASADATRARNEPRIAAMNRAIAHRGPDDEGQHFDSGIALGFRRLAIVDLTAAGHQPMTSADGRWTLVFNGEIYNHVELAAELKGQGCVFQSRSDTEVILHAWARWGEACLDRFNGMWAFALWDRDRQRLVAARDRFGVKPFVYTERDGELLFSSELAGLRAALPLHEADLGRLHDFLAWGYRRNDGRTMLAGVHELPPAHLMTVERGQVLLRRWWTLPEAGEVPPPPQRAARLRELLADAVRLRLRSDVPVALLQSGGLDSSVIAALVNDEVDAGRASGITAFTAIHPGHAEDESAAVRLLMQRCPRLESVLLEPPHEELADALPAFVAAMQEPVFGPTAYAHWELMRAVRERGLKVMLNGQGADEALGGYTTYLSGYRLLDLLLAAPWRVPGEMAAMRRNLDQGLAAQVAQLAKAVLGRRAASAWRGWASEGGSRVLAAELRAEQGSRLPLEAMRLAPHNLRDHMRRQLLADGFNQILHYEDQSSMSQGIEMRSPFVDWRVMSYAFALPDEERYAGGVGKRLLRQAFAERLPPAIATATRKIGFAMPLAAWVRGARFQRLLHELVSSPEFASRRLWDARRLRARLLDPHAVERGFPLWRFVTTELWLREMNIRNA